MVPFNSSHRCAGRRWHCDRSNQCFLDLDRQTLEQLDEIAGDHFAACLFRRPVVRFRGESITFQFDLLIVTQLNHKDTKPLSHKTTNSC